MFFGDLRKVIQMLVNKVVFHIVQYGEDDNIRLVLSGDFAASPPPSFLWSLLFLRRVQQRCHTPNSLPAREAIGEKLV